MHQLHTFTYYWASRIIFLRTRPTTDYSSGRTSRTLFSFNSSFSLHVITTGRSALSTFSPKHHAYKTTTNRRLSSVFSLFYLVNSHDFWLTLIKSYGVYPGRPAFHNGLLQKEAIRTQSFTDNRTFLYNAPHASVACSQKVFPDKSSYIRQRKLYARPC